MRRVYRNVHIGLISAMLLAAIAFEAGAGDRTNVAEMAPDSFRVATESR